MAGLKVDGFDELERRLQAIEKGLKGEAEDRMLKAGAAVLVESWKGSIESRGHRISGAMKDSVAATEVQHKEDGAEIHVYPQGTDNHRITNAQKAYILHYGRQATRRGTKGIKGDRFVTAAENEAKTKIFEAMQAALNAYLAGKE